MYFGPQPLLLVVIDAWEADHYLQSTLMSNFLRLSRGLRIAGLDPHACWCSQTWH